MTSTTLAAIDIGSNAVRLLINNVIEFEGERMFKKINIVRLPIRLGEDVFRTGSISERNLRRMLNAMRAYREILVVHGVDHYRGCATSAVRHASNGGELVRDIHRETGLEIEVISGEEEADIIYFTHAERLLHRAGAYLYVDVGGGSTECTFFHEGEPLASRSFRIGTIRLLQDIVPGDHWAEFEAWLADLASTHGQFDLIGSGGNINNVFKSSLTKKGDPLSAKYIRDFYDFIRSQTYEERIARLDHKPDRADVIEPAMRIFTTVFEQTGARRIYVPKIGLTDGIIRRLAEDVMV